MQAPHHTPETPHPRAPSRPIGKHAAGVSALHILSRRRSLSSPLIALCSCALRAHAGGCEAKTRVAGVAVQSRRSHERNPDVISSAFLRRCSGYCSFARAGSGWWYGRLPPGYTDDRVDSYCPLAGQKKKNRDELRDARKQDFRSSVLVLSQVRRCKPAAERLRLEGNGPEPC